jgi:hypothetical protein
MKIRKTPSGIELCSTPGTMWGLGAAAALRSGSLQSNSHATIVFARRSSSQSWERYCRINHSGHRGRISADIVEAAICITVRVSDAWNQP